MTKPAASTVYAEARRFRLKTRWNCKYIGTGTLPQTFFVELYRNGMDDSEPMLRGKPIELRP